MTSRSHKNHQTTPWNTLRATCSAARSLFRAAYRPAAGLVLGVALVGPPVAQTADWNHPAVERSTHRTAQYEVVRDDTASVWSEYRVGWTAVDHQGRTVRTTPVTVNVTQPAPAPIPSDASTQVAGRTEFVDDSARFTAPSQTQFDTQQRNIPLPAAIIQRSLLSGGVSAAPTAADYLRRRSVEVEPARPTTASGVVRLVNPGAPAPTRSAPPARPFPIETIEYATQSEERAYRLFEVPGQSPQSDAASQDLATLWERAQITAGGVARVSNQDVLPAPQPVAEPNVGKVMLDGLDAVATGQPEAPRGYQPTPLQDIRPCREYSPGTSELASGQPPRIPKVEQLPENWDMVERNFAHLDYMWVPSNIFYNPLYFEDPALERYGHSHGPLLQPLASISRFGVQLVGLPYQMALDPPHRRVYPLGFFRPGDCAPAQVPNIPLNAEAAAKAGAVYTGLIFAFP